MGSWIHDGFLDSWNPCVKDFRILDLLESIIGFNKSFVQWAGIEVKNKKLMPICQSLNVCSLPTQTKPQSAGQNHD